MEWISTDTSKTRARSRRAVRGTVQRDSDAHESRTARVVRRVRAIPAGFVRTYGDIDPIAPRLVGLVLATIDVDVPWHRVVRSDGSLAKGKRQQALLLAEGVPMRGDRVDLRHARLPADP